MQTVTGFWQFRSGGEVVDGIGDEFNLFALQLRINRQRDRSVGGLFRFGEIALFVAQAGETFLLMQ